MKITRSVVERLIVKYASFRPLHEIARDIRRDWGKVYFGAKPYLDSMSKLDSINDFDSHEIPAREIVFLFLFHANDWRGPVANIIKSELKSMLPRSYTTPRFARFAEGDTAGFEKWLKSQPQKVQDDWAANKEKYGDKFKKKAYLDPAIREEVMPMLRIVLAILRAQYLSYQTSHWQTRGPAYYGNHLLFQRLYEGVQAEIDALGEKLVGYFGIEAVDLEVSLDLVCEMVSRWCSHESHFQRGLTSEGELQDALAIIRNGWPEAHYPLPLGLDDWLSATANAHESNQYLLQQVLGAPASEWPAVMGRNAALQLQKVSVPLATIMGVTPTFTDGLAYGSLVIHKSNRGGWVLSFSPEQSDGTRAPAFAIQSAKTRKNAEVFLEAIVNVVPAVARAQSKSDVVRYKDEILEALSTANTSLPQSSIPVSDKRDQVRQLIQNMGLMSLGERHGKAGEFFGPKGGSRVISLGKREVLLNTYQITNYGYRFGESWVLVRSELISKITPELIEKWARWVKQGPTMIEVRNKAREGGEGSVRRASGALSTEHHFYDNPRKRETREFAESGAPTNVPDVGKDFAKEHGNGKVVRQVRKAPPTPEEILEEQPGAEGASTLSRLVVKSEEPDIAPAAKANRALMASWLREINSRR